MTRGKEKGNNMEQNGKEEAKQAKTMAVIAGIVAVVVLGAVLAIALPGQTPKDTASNNADTKNSQQDTTQTTDDVTKETATITYTDEGFSPSTLTVKKGTIVTVDNKSSRSVQFSSNDHPAHTDDPEINMPVIASGVKGTFTATTVGTHGFHDHLDDSKVGTLVVTE